MTTLFEDVRSEQNVFAAWRHVRRSALHSPNTEIRGLAAEFEHQHQRHLKRIIRQLREGRFEFDEAKGVLKDKKKRLAAGKTPRPIAIATLKNRIVQRAILQVLQPRTSRDERAINARYEPVEDKRLGRLNLVNRSPFGVGGLLYPYGGIRPAIDLVLRAMANGGRYYFQSDIKSFFTKIPVQNIVDFIKLETNDQKLADLFLNALEVHLSNKEELLSYANLFPSSGVGVAQGSSLSTFAGNVLLYDFDHQLNNLGVIAVRYIDDFLIIAETESQLEQAIDFCKDYLHNFGFSLYPPVPGSDKASQGKCKDAFNFLGCTLQPNRCVPSRLSIRKTIEDVQDKISESKQNIKTFLEGHKPLDPTLSRSAVLHALGKKLYGWQKSYDFCTDADAFNNLDQDISKKILDYENFIRRKTNSTPIDKLLPILGIPLTGSLYLKPRASVTINEAA